MYIFSVRARPRLLALLLPVLTALGQAHQATTFSDDPTGTESGRLLLWVSVFAVVAAAIIVGALIYGKRRARGSRDALEAVWIAVPVILIAVVGILGAQSLVQLFSAGAKPAFGVQLTASRYWWDFDYFGTPVRVSNELVLPVGTAVELRFSATDAFHAPNVPEVGLKASAMPGQNTRAVIRFKRIGNYPGFCAEQCGPAAKQHRFRVIVVDAETFDRFLQAATDFTPPEPATPAERAGQTLFMEQCAACHTVRGTAARGTQGPDLTLLANRTTLGAASLPNTPQNLRTWIRSAPDLKPGVAMPAFPNLNDDELDALVAYLGTLGLPEFDFSTLPHK